jgi:hypothetical protein
LTFIHSLPKMQVYKDTPNAMLKIEALLPVMCSRSAVSIHYIPLNVLLLALRLSLLLGLPLAESLPSEPAPKPDGRFFSTLVGAKVISFAPTASPLPPPLLRADGAGARAARSPNDLPARSFCRRASLPDEETCI